MFGYCLFEPHSQFLIIVSFVLLGVSLFIFEFFEKKWLPLIILAVAAGVAGFMYATLDPFLNMWDEQYHVLVAKNMIEHPFKPMLYRDFIQPYDYTTWVGNEVWLHKQPLFMWQMALSMAIFGINEIAARLPDIIMHIGMVFLIFRIGQIAIDRRAGFYAAALYAFAHFPLELIAGNYVAEHNDKAFIFYITASFWAFFEYRNKSRQLFIYLIGIFAGMAVLCKWLAGLLVFGPWFLTVFFYSEGNRFAFKNYLPLIKAFIVSVLVFLPWQIYIFYAFPKEALHEFEYTSRHLTEAIEGHTGDLWFHIDSMRRLILDYQAVLYIVIAGLVFLYFQISKKEYYLSVISSVLAVYLFYTAACTKMDGFTSIVTPLIFLGFASIIVTLYKLSRLLRIKYLRSSLMLIIVFISSFFFTELDITAEVHTVDDNVSFNFRNAKKREVFFFKKMNSYLKGENYVIYNSGLNLFSNISGMFYTPYICHSGIPTEEQINESINKGYKVAVFNLDSLPEYIYKDPRVKVINLPYKQSFKIN